MNISTNRIIFLGTPQIAVPTLNALAETAFRPVAVITEPDKPVGRKQIVTPSAVKVATLALNIPVFEPASASELQAIVQHLEPTLGIVIAYGRILKPEVIDIPRSGFVNLHFSLLPAYRGATPIQAAILSGETTTGVTMMQIDQGLDTGSILGYAEQAIEPNDTTQSLGHRLADTAAALACELIPLYLDQALRPQPQPISNDTVTRRLTKEDGAIDWSMSPETIERFIRAMNPWPLAWTEAAGVRIIIHEIEQSSDMLILKKVQVAGSRIISGQDFSRGYPDAYIELQQRCPQIGIYNEK